MAKFWVYIVACSDSSLYTGSTKDVVRRVAQHNSGSASKYTRSRLPVRLAYAEEAVSWGEALKREMEIKRLNRASKLRLCSSFKRERNSSR